MEDGTPDQYSFLYQKDQNDKGQIGSHYIRITVNGQRIDQSIQRYIEVARWSAAAQYHLDTLTGKVLKLEREMV